jgi:predicted RNA binding protein YcfA (HicA-like mRNA interferase family)
MSFSKQVWEQLKNKTADDLCSALVKDGFVYDAKAGSERVYRHPDGRRVSIHYHPRKCFGPGLLKGLLSDAGWNEADLIRLKLTRR